MLKALKGQKSQSTFPQNWQTIWFKKAITMSLLLHDLHKNWIFKYYIDKTKMPIKVAVLQFLFVQYA